MYAANMAARHPQINYKSNRATELKLKSSLDNRYCRLKGLTDTQLLTAWEQEGCDSTPNKPKAESAASLKGKCFQKHITKVASKAKGGRGETNTKARLCEREWSTDVNLWSSGSPPDY